MKTKENWIEDTLNSLNTIQRVDVPLSLRSSLVNNSKPKEIKFSAIQKWTIAASVIVLLGINLISITHYSKNTKVTSSLTNEKNVVYKEYFSSDY